MGDSMHSHFGSGRQIFRKHHSDSGGSLSEKTTMSERTMGTGLSMKESLNVLQQYGIRPFGRIATSKEEARDIAQEYGGGLYVLKVATQKKGKMKSGLIEFNVPADKVADVFE